MLNVLSVLLKVWIERSLWVFCSPVWLWASTVFVLNQKWIVLWQRQINGDTSSYVDVSPLNVIKSSSDALWVSKSPHPQAFYLLCHSHCDSEWKSQHYHQKGDVLKYYIRAVAFPQWRGRSFQGLPQRRLFSFQIWLSYISRWCGQFLVCSQENECSLSLSLWPIHILVPLSLWGLL